MGNEVGTDLWMNKLRTRFEYRDSGGLYYREAIAGNLKGVRFGHHRNDGYRVGTFLGRTELEHRLIWSLLSGDVPNIVDHIDRDCRNNRYDNLRNVSQVENCRNQRVGKNNKSGVTGVCFCNTSSKWKAYYTKEGKHKSLGYFHTKEGAVEARKRHETEENWFE